MRRPIAGPARRVLAALLDLSPMHAEALARHTGVPTATVRRVLVRAVAVGLPVSRTRSGWTLSLETPR